MRRVKKWTLEAGHSEGLSALEGSQRGLESSPRCWGRNRASRAAEVTLGAARNQDEPQFLFSYDATF